MEMLLYKIIVSKHTYMNAIIMLILYLCIYMYIYTYIERERE